MGSAFASINISDYDPDVDSLSGPPKMPKHITKRFRELSEENTIDIYYLSTGFDKVHADLMQWEAEADLVTERVPARFPHLDAPPADDKNKKPDPDVGQHPTGPPSYLWIIGNSLQGGGHVLIWARSKDRVLPGDIVVLYFGVTYPSGLAASEAGSKVGVPGSAGCGADVLSWALSRDREIMERKDGNLFDRVDDERRRGQDAAALVGRRQVHRPIHAKHCRHGRNGRGV